LASDTHQSQPGDLQGLTNLMAANMAFVARMVDDDNGEIEVVASNPQGPGPQQHQTEVVVGMAHW
jgi:hypothetical protein